VNEVTTQRCKPHLVKGTSFLYVRNRECSLHKRNNLVQFISNAMRRDPETLLKVLVSRNTQSGPSDKFLAKEEVILNRGWIVTLPILCELRIGCLFTSCADDYLFGDPKVRWLSLPKRRVLLCQ